jgi:hypothetical protein
VTGALDLHEIPGDHFALLRPPCVEVLAERLAQAVGTSRNERKKQAR